MDAARSAITIHDQGLQSRTWWNTHRNEALNTFDGSTVKLSRVAAAIEPTIVVHRGRLPTRRRRKTVSEELICRDGTVELTVRC